ncbi:hypothetical protein, partial [Paraburkholderia sp. SIMBA_027]|uniref:hypothetical protein n=1 Tax=Paraburkholderia sp. SIMBA_027 TaxID=3085770 RepID=UPI00397C11B0
PDLQLLGVVATLVKTVTTLHTEILDETRKYLHENGITFFDTCIPSTIRFASSVAYDNLPAALTKKKVDKANLYFDLWKE